MYTNFYHCNINLVIFLINFIIKSIHPLLCFYPFIFYMIMVFFFKCVIMILETISMIAETISLF